MGNDSSSFWSKYHDWFVELGYPKLDIHELPSGEWYILQTFNAPVIPHLTKWNVVLQGMRNIIPTKGMVAKFLKQLDPSRKEFWKREEAATKKAEDAYESKERHAEDLIEKATEAVTKNSDLMERVVEKGVQEMDLPALRKVIPRNKL